MSVWSNVSRALIAVIAGAVCFSPALSEYSLAFMRTVGETSQPIGHYEFCLQYPQECEYRSSTAEAVVLTEFTWAQLVQVNNLVNTTITPATDMEIFGRAEVWFYPSTRGDCEDFVLLKRRILIENGWPVSALLITVAKRPNGEGHAVLTVRTDRGDLVLDNLNGEIRLWGDTPYLYLKRQSELHPGRWVAIEDNRTAVARISR
jgi:predicted transglutaminase-like cysteine proteinase